jgi:hypothetical protein
MRTIHLVKSLSEEKALLTWETTSEEEEADGIAVPVVVASLGGGETAAAASLLGPQPMMVMSAELCCSQSFCTFALRGRRERVVGLPMLLELPPASRQTCIVKRASAAKCHKWGFSPASPTSDSKVFICDCVMP